MVDREVGDVDLGDGHSFSYTRWNPDDTIPENREQFGFPTPCVERVGAIIYHSKPDGSPCWGHVYFDIPEVRRFPKSFPDAVVWQVQSWDPLTISPSVLCKLCGDHGFIRDGKWVRA